MISDRFTLFKNLKLLRLNCNNEYKICNEIGDEGCKAIFINAKYLSNIEELWLGGNRW